MQNKKVTSKKVKTLVGKGAYFNINCQGSNEASVILLPSTSTTSIYNYAHLHSDTGYIYSITPKTSRLYSVVE